jgi:hypothetical protein
VKSTPSLPVHNRFECLEIEECNDICDPHKPILDVPKSAKIRPKAWERRLPKKYIVASTPGENSLEIQVGIQASDANMEISTSALLDCGATGMFMDSEYVKANKLPTRTLSRPIPVYNVDGTANEAGAIREIVDVTLRYRDHSERAQFAITSLGKESVLLGYTWLQEHNPEVNWQTKEVKMSRCPTRCRTCLAEAKCERREKAAEARRIRTCRDGPMHSVSEDFDSLPDIPGEEGEETAEEDSPIEGDEPQEGERIFMTWIYPEEHIRASATTSQRLAEAFAKNSTPRTFRDTVPDHLHDFEDVFAKESFDTLPDRKQWDHAIELVPGAEPSSCKVYPLAPNEQAELDEFIKENLATGRIRPSKSPMASPVFFIKKKDGGLRLIQDYRSLNAKTIKNRYPLPLASDLINQLRGAKIFTKLDVRWGYNNVRIKEGDEWKAAFRTNRGLYEPLVMFFGLTNSPATFQTMMNDIFQDLVMEGVVCVFIDDILIYTKTMEEHRRVVREVLERLRAHKLYL